MSTMYQQFFWTIAADVTAEPKDIGWMTRAQLHKAAWDLNSIPSILLAVAGGGTAQDHPEISLTFPVESHSSAEQFTDRIQKALASYGLHAKLFLQEETRFYSLDESAVKRVKAAVSFREDEKETLGLVESVHSVTIAPPESISPLVANGSSPVATAPGLAAVNSSFTITPGTYAALKKARGDTIRTVTEQIYDSLRSLQNETRASAVAFKMVAGGLVTVGVVMYKAYAALAGVIRASSAPTFGVAALAAALAAAGGPAGIAAAATVAVGYFVLSKDAVNDLLLTNDSKFRIIFNGDHIQNGERAFKVDGIPARVDLADGTVAAYPCGAYVYRKYRMGFLGAFGPCGSLFGIRFYAHRGDLVDGFSVGMDCPNTAAGGRNSILCIADTAMVASGGASASGDEGSEATTTYGKITGRRADAWGDVNYGFAVFESTA